MSESNGIIRIGRKGLKKFAFGAENTPEGVPFEVDVVVAWQAWIVIDDSFRDADDGLIPLGDMERYHQAAVEFVSKLSSNVEPPLTTTEALEFLARLKEAYNEVSRFFRPRSREELASPDSSEAGHLFSAEAS